MAYYNESVLNNQTNFYQIITDVNSSYAGGMIGNLILLAVAILTFLALKNYDTKAAFMVSMFITSVLAVLLFIIEWVALEVMVIPIILLLISVFYAVVVK